LRETDCFDIGKGESDREYIPIDIEEMKSYITDHLSKLKYPYEEDKNPNTDRLVSDLQIASERMLTRCSRFGIKSDFTVLIKIGESDYQIYPSFMKSPNVSSENKTILCSLDLRLLRRNLDRSSHWNNAEIGAHISFVRTPNVYEPDLHTALQFLHL